MAPAAYAIDISKDFGPARNFPTFGALLSIIIPLLLTVCAFVLLLVIMHGSYMYLRAGGNPEYLQKSKKTIGWALMGFITILLSYLLARLIGRIFNFDLL